jgi:hypothetical protein
LLPLTPTICSGLLSNERVVLRDDLLQPTKTSFAGLGSAHLVRDDRRRHDCLRKVGLHLRNRLGHDRLLDHLLDPTDLLDIALPIDAPHSRSRHSGLDQ